MWLRRINVFDYNNNPYYKPLGTFNIYSAYNSIQMPNCTQYCFLRMHEASEQTERQSKWIRASGGFGNAKTWYDTTTLPKGKELREGAIAVFDGNCGHVFYVEHKLDDTHADLSTESNFNENKSLRDWHFFNVRKNVELVVGKATLAGVGKLIGYIYIPIKDIRVQRDITKHQVEITEEMVNVRVKPNGEVFCKGLYAPTGIYNIKSVEIVDNYKWYELEKNHWVREGDWTKEYEVDEKDYKALYKEAMAKLEKIRKAGGWNG